MGIIDTMLSYGDDVKAYEYLLGRGLTVSATEQLWQMYQDQAKNGGSAGGSNYNDANDSGLEQLQRQLLELQDRIKNPSVVPQRALELIQGYYERGSITEETARRLLSNYGIYI